MLFVHKISSIYTRSTEKTKGRSWWGQREGDSSFLCSSIPYERFPYGMCNLNLKMTFKREMK